MLSTKLSNKAAWIFMIEIMKEKIQLGGYDQTKFCDLINEVLPFVSSDD